jgi:hypothetical protein
MLSGQLGLDVLDEAHHLVLPLAGVAQPLVADFVEDVVEIVDCFNDFPDVSLLDFHHLRHLERMDFDAPPIGVGIAIDSRNIVVLVEGVLLERMLQRLFMKIQSSNSMMPT